jgi:hypothetical protein
VPSEIGFVRDRYVVVEQQSVVLGAHFIVMQRPLDAVTRMSPSTAR